MHFSAIVLASAVSVATATSLSTGQQQAKYALDRIMGRQIQLCAPVSTPSCSLSCGAGFVTCVVWPNCYNPSAGEICCSDGSYCNSGYYCTNEGCCPSGRTLAQCGASSSLSVVPPPIPGSTTSSSSASTRSSTGTTSAASYSYQLSSSSTTSTTTSTTTHSSTTTTTSSRTATSTTVKAANAAPTVGIGAAQMAIGGLGMLMLL